MYAELLPELYTARELENVRRNDYFLCSKRAPTVYVLKRYFLTVVYFAAEKTVEIGDQWIITGTSHFEATNVCKTCRDM